MMKKRSWLLAALCLAMSMPLHGFAEQSLLPETLHVRTLRESAPAKAEDAAPALLDAPTESAAPAPIPSPVPEEGDFVLLGHRTAVTQLDMAGYYLAEMAEAAAAGDLRLGQEAERARDLALSAGGRGDPLRFEDLLLLARLIDAMAGSDWLTEDFRLCVGEVVLNRVASPEFPNTLREVIYQRGQYSVANTPRFASLVPRRECVDAALRLLQGERHMVPAVVYQADYLQGELFTMFPDRRLGSTYFCLSNRLELYP